MKRILASLLILIMFIVGISFSSQKTEAEEYIYSVVYAHKNSILVKWVKYRKATKYVIYRAASKKCDGLIKRSKFKKIKTIKNRKVNKYNDKKIKFSRYYTYYIKVFKGKKVYTDTYSPYDQDYACKGLSPPELFNSTNEEDVTHGKLQICLYVDSNARGAKKAKKFVLYKKQKGQKKYKKITLKKISGHYYDTNITKGKTYYYKAKSYKKKKGKKKFYSMYSNVLKVSAVDFKGQFNVNTISPISGIYKANYLQAIIKVKSLNKYNGKTVLYNFSHYLPYASYKVNTGKVGDDDKWHFYYVKIAGYSYDNKTYHTIPKKGIDLNGKETYLKLAIMTRGDWSMDDDHSNKRIIIGGNNCEYAESYLDLEGFVTYYGPTNYATTCNINLKTGSMEVHS